MEAKKTLAEFVAIYTETNPLANPDELVRAYQRYCDLVDAINS